MENIMNSPLEFGTTGALLMVLWFVLAKIVAPLVQAKLPQVQPLGEIVSELKLLNHKLSDLVARIDRSEEDIEQRLRDVARQTTDNSARIARLEGKLE